MLKEKILYIDIETVPVVYSYSDLDEKTKKLWDRKWQYNKENTAEELYKKAGIYAEFAKVICIGFGYRSNKGFETGVLAGDDEKSLLKQFADLITRELLTNNIILCAHNGKEFDFPFLGRRFLVNALPMPEPLQLQGKKPWEVKHLDTMELWKFGDYKSYSSLDLLAHLFGIPSPKEDIDGSQVARVYYEEKNLKRIADYCCRDVVTLARVYARFAGLPVIPQEEIIFV